MPLMFEIFPWKGIKPLAQGNTLGEESNEDYALKGQKQR